MLILKKSENHARMSFLFSSFFLGKGLKYFKNLHFTDEKKSTIPYSLHLMFKKIYLSWYKHTLCKRRIKLRENVLENKLFISATILI